MRESGRCALAKWAWKGKQYVVQVRPAEDGLVLQQLLYADEVRSLKELDIEKVTVSDAELKLALQLIDQISEDTYDPTQFEDEEKKRILAAIDEKIAGKQVVADGAGRAAAGRPGDRPDGSAARQPGHARRRQGQGGRPRPPRRSRRRPRRAKERKGVKRAPKVAEEVAAAPARVRAKK